MTQQVQDAPPLVEQATEEGTDRRRLAVFGLIGLVVVGLLGWLLLGSGGGEDTQAVVPSGKRGLVAAPATPSAKPTTLPPASNGALGRDPFRPVISTAAPAPVSTGGAVAGPGAVASPAATPAAKPTAAPTYALRLTRVDGSGANLTARFLLGKSTIQYARVGSRFGRTAEIKLISLTSDGGGKGSAVIQVGEAPFDLSTGDPAIYVQ